MVDNVQPGNQTLSSPSTVISAGVISNTASIAHGNNIPLGTNAHLDEDEPNQAGSAGPFLHWTSETIQTPEMEKVGIVVNTTAQVAICLSCKSVVKPKALHKHINYDHHPLAVTREFCSKLVQEYQLIGEPQRPQSIGLPIFGLPIFLGYISCNTCGAAFQAKPSMVRHARENPSCSKGSSQKKPVQAYFPRSNRMYFAVVPPPTTTTPNLDPVTLIKKFYSPLPFESIPINPANNFRDANNFLRIEKWEEYVQGMTGEEIQEIIREREPELRESVRLIVKSYARDMIEKLDTTDHPVKVAIGDYNG